MKFETNGFDKHIDVNGVYGVTLSRILVGDEAVVLTDKFGRVVHTFLSPSVQDLEDNDPEATGKAIMLTTRETLVTVTDHSGDPLIVTFSVNKV